MSIIHEKQNPKNIPEKFPSVQLEQEREVREFAEMLSIAESKEIFQFLSLCSSFYIFPFRVDRFICTFGVPYQCAFHYYTYSLNTYRSPAPAPVVSTPPNYVPVFETPTHAPSRGPSAAPIPAYN